jgi:hypothetical protein
MIGRRFLKLYARRGPRFSLAGTRFFHKSHLLTTESSHDNVKKKLQLFSSQKSVSTAEMIQFLQSNPQLSSSQSFADVLSVIGNKMVPLHPSVLGVIADAAAQRAPNSSPMSEDQLCMLILPPQLSSFLLAQMSQIFINVQI